MCYSGYYYKVIILNCRNSGETHDPCKLYSADTDFHQRIEYARSLEGKFITWSNDEWLFENKESAILFKLRWA